MDKLQKITPVLVALAVIGLAAAGFFGYKYVNAKKQLQTITTDPSTVQKAAQAEVKALVAQVSKLIDLPTGEDPTVATITDVNKLKDQSFFAHAKNGDKVLIYTNAKKAILYDPDANKIIDVAPVNIGSSSATQAQAKVALRNGTATSGLTTKVETSLKKSYPDLNVVSRDNSNRTDYDKSVVVVLNDNAKDAASNLAKTLGVSVGSLPSGEDKPQGADIIVILGKDQT